MKAVWHRNGIHINSQKLIAGPKEKAVQNRKSLQKKSQAKRTAKTVGTRVDVKL